MTAETAHPRPGRARAALAGTIADLPPIGLAEVMTIAQLQTRVDRKYLLTPEQFTTAVGSLGGLSALHIGDRRLFGYESTYFDTSDLEFFRAHKQRRRRRYKVRTRTYLDSQETMFEVKLKTDRGQTSKHRQPHPLAEREVLNPSARTFLNDVLGQAHGVASPPLEPVLRTTYSRATFVDTQDGARLTCDVDLECAAGDTARSGPDLVLLESKSSHGAARADRVLSSMGLRPISMSKYCIGTALLHPQLAANPWNRLLRQRFGWARDR